MTLFERNLIICLVSLYAQQYSCLSLYKIDNKADVTSVSICHIIKAYRGHVCKTPYILYRDFRLRQATDFTFWPLYPQY